MKTKIIKYVKVLAIFIGGVAVGAVLMGYLSVRASRTFVEVFRANYYAEQSTLAADAHNKGDKFAELAYRRNVVDSSPLIHLKVFNTMKTAWTFSFPFAAPILDRITNPPDIEEGRKLAHAIDLGRLAEATDNLGLKEEADKLWSEAAKLMGHNDINRVRVLISDMHKIEADKNAKTEKK